jgi:hypothetical protein
MSPQFAHTSAVPERFIQSSSIRVIPDVFSWASRFPNSLSPQWVHDTMRPPALKRSLEGSPVY